MKEVKKYFFKMHENVEFAFNNLKSLKTSIKTMPLVLI
jgi:hypothetical protein